MRTSNLANQAVRQSEVGHVWEEVLSGTSGTLEVQKYSTFRVRAAANLQVFIDGVLAATMTSGEVIIFNAGPGRNLAPYTDIPTVSVQITGAAYVQLALDNQRSV